MNATAHAMATWALLLPGSGGPCVPGWSSRRLRLIPRWLPCKEVQAGEGAQGRGNTPRTAPRARHLQG